MAESTWTKRKFILAAYEELGMASYDFDLSPEMLQAALRRLDIMMSQWFSVYGLAIGYPLPVEDTSDLDDATTIAYGNNDAVYLNLAVLLAAKHGKVLPTPTKAQAKQRWLDLLKEVAFPAEMTMPDNLPRGAGAKNWDFPFFSGVPESEA